MSLTILEEHIDLQPDKVKRFKASAKEDIPKGTIIGVNDPIGIALLPEFVSQRCQNCLVLRGEDLLRCSRCKKAGYCTKQCQKQDWIACHKVLCPLPPSPLVESLDFQILAKIVLFLSKYPTSDFTKSWHRLMPAKGLLAKEANQRHFDIIATTLISLLPEMACKAANTTSADDPKTKAFLIATLGRYHANSFVMHDSDLFPFAEAAFPDGSLYFNHSCYPNAVIDYQSRQQYVRLISDVKRGQEVTLSYTDGAVPRTRRRRMLSDKYGFDCDCEKCQGDLATLDKAVDATKPGSSVEAMKQHFKIEIESTIPSAKYEKWDIDGFSSFVLSSDGLLPLDDNSHRTRLVKLVPTLLKWPTLISSIALQASTSLFYDYLDVQDWPHATQIAKFVMAHYLIAYPVFWPMTGQHAFNVSKSVWNNDKALGEEEAAKQALQYATYAREILLVSQGKTSTVLNDVNIFVDLVESEITKQKQTKQEITDSAT